MMKMSEQEFIEISEMIHEWRDVVGYEGLYKVSEYGDVIALNYLNKGEKRLINQRKRKSGYMQVNLYKNGRSETLLVHRLVATAFCEGAEYFSEVNHIDEDKTNNHYSNLEWCSHNYNMSYGTRNERAVDATRKKVKCVELDMIFNSVSEAAEYMCSGTSTISNCLVGRYKTSGGYHWEYVD